jgi:GNAT superfamily N-acetyltransferase
MHEINYVINQIPSEEQLVDLYSAVEWGHSSYPSMLLRAIENPTFLVCAYYNTDLIAFGRAISDGVFTVYFTDLLVKPDWQNKGIGSRLMDKLLDHFNGFLKTSENYQSQFYQAQRQAFNPRFGEALSFVESVNREHFSTTGFARSLRLIHSRIFQPKKFLGFIRTVSRSSVSLNSGGG